MRPGVAFLDHIALRTRLPPYSPKDSNVVLSIARAIQDVALNEVSAKDALATLDDVVKKADSQTGAGESGATVAETLSPVVMRDAHGKGRFMERLNGLEIEALTDALASAFPSTGELDALVQFKLGRPLNEITNPDARHARIADMALDVVRWTMARGARLDDLVLGALNQNPDNPNLRAIAAGLGLDQGAAMVLEDMVRRNVEIADIDAWQETMAVCERAVCLVEIGGAGNGTGFLVGPSLVVTNYHVMETVIAGPAKQGDVTLRFDYKLNAESETVQEGKTYHLVSGEAWLAASSPQDTFDYALLRVKGTPAQDQVAGQPGAPQRGYLSPQPRVVATGDPVLIIQHALANPLKFAIGSVLDRPTAPDRIAYSANTDHGSSGSPCFTDDWRLVALHKQGSRDYNEGVVFAAIVQDWTRQGVVLAPS